MTNYLRQDLENNLAIISLEKALRFSVIAGSALVLIGCGSPKTGSKGSGDADLTEELAGDQNAEQLGCGEQSHDNSAPTFRLKGTSLLLSSLNYTLGAGKDRDINNMETSIFTRYGGQFGSTDGLSFGETYSDLKSETLKMTGYMMALNIVARNAALLCSSEDGAADCQCDTEATSSAMLARAIPYRGFCPGDEYVTEFAKLCQADNVGAITALVSSTAFALRN